MNLRMLWIAALALFTTAANANIITYTWVQTSATMPGLTFTASYQVMQGIPPLPANSMQSAPDFGGLVALQIEGGNLPTVTLADLVPACQSATCTPCPDPFGCIMDFPDWSINVPTFHYISPSDSWDYFVTATTMQADTDGGFGSPCFQTAACRATGYWRSNAPGPLPEPWTVFGFVAGLLLVFRRQLLRSFRKATPALR